MSVRTECNNTKESNNKNKLPVHACVLITGYGDFSLTSTTQHMEHGILPKLGRRCNQLLQWPITYTLLQS
jgi:hypothetical protein